MVRLHILYLSMDSTLIHSILFFYSITLGKSNGGPKTAWIGAQNFPQIDLAK